MKKNKRNGSSDFQKKILRCFFRFYLIFLVVGTTKVSAETTYAQSVRFSLDLNNVSVEQLFAEIEKSSEYIFFYKEDLPVHSTVSVHTQNETLNSILDKTLDAQGLTYQINDRQVVVTEKKAVAVPVAKQAQQQKTITGTVVDASGIPLLGVSILIQGTGTGTVTDLDGNFTLEVAEGATLELSYIGYSKTIVKVGAENVYPIVMREDTQALDEVVVVGYGSQRKINLTGAVGTVKTEKALQGRPVTNVQELLTGSIPGLNITKESGAVGSGAKLNIRGTSTIGTSSGVLVIVDGFPGNINMVNPNDIESVSVLKDAASAAIYGSRAANGVILITTKKGKEMDRPVVEVSTSVGLQNPDFRADFVGTEDYMKLWDQAMINDGKDPIYGAQGLADLKSGKYADTQWYKEIYRRNTLINNNYMALSGQQKGITYRLSGAYDYQDGTLPNNNYERYNIKPDMNIQLTDKLSLRANLQYTETHINEPQGGTTAFQSQAARIAPIYHVKEANGKYGVGGTMGGNPIAGVNEGGYKENNYKELMTILELNYSPIENLNIKGNFANYTYDYLSKDRVSTYYLYDANGEIAKTENAKSSLKQTTDNDRRTTLQLTADYHFSINQSHNFKFLGGYSQEYAYYSNFWGSRDDMPFDGVDVLDAGSSNKQNGGAANDVAIQSYFARVNYDYQSRYLFEVNVRADGSSRFAEGHRWGAFPSFSAGWNITGESFMENVDWVSMLKLRASWGLLGDAEKVDYYATAQALTYVPNAYSFNGEMAAGAYMKKAVNADISWEKAAVTNIGVDASFFDSRLSVTADYFMNKRSDILYASPVPLEFGLPAPYSNLLSMENRGYELSVSYKDNAGDFSWGIDGNISSSKNKITDLGGDEYWIEGDSYTHLGGQYQVPYGYIAEGLFQNQDEIDAHATQFAALYPGNIAYTDQNKDGKIDGADKAVITEKVPVIYGFNLNFGYKQFDMSANFYGKFNTFRYMSGAEGWAFYLSQNARPMHLDAWTPENTDATYPRLTAVNTSNDYIYSSYWLKKANFLKLQNLQIGYTFGKSLLEKLKMSYARVYISGQNLATFTGYDGFDPENGSLYPLSRTWALGLNLKF